MPETARVVVVVRGDDPLEWRSKADELASTLHLPQAREQWTEEAPFALLFNGGRLELRGRDFGGRGVSVTFNPPVRHGRVAVTRNQPLGKAFGSRVESIADATAGLGGDAFLLACMGFHVTAIERSPIVAALLEDGVRRALEDGRIRNAIEGRLHVVCADARSWLAAAEDRPDAVYMDPMFPAKRKKSALAKKPIRMVREIVGDDADAAELFAAAVAAARDRVVVKRPDYAPPLVPNPTASHAGKLVRYDVYHAQQSIAPTLNIDPISPG